LTEVYGVASGNQREVGAIVGHEEHRALTAQPDELAEQREHAAGVLVLRAKLQGRRAAVDHRSREREGIERARVEAVEIDNGIEPVHPTRRVERGGHLSYTLVRMMRLAQGCLGVATIAALLTGSVPAAAEDPAPAAAPPPAAEPAPKPAAVPAKRAGAKLPLAVKVTVEARSPDPPWKVRIENTSDKPIRIPADVRLLSFELASKTSKGVGRKHKCEAPRAMRPSGFPDKRELYLEPGGFYEEVFDPRLFCFGASADGLKEGTTAKPTFGWAGGGAKGPFAAQGTDRPEAYQAQRKIAGDELVLPAAHVAPPKLLVAGVGPRMEREGSEDGPEVEGAWAKVEDRNAPQLDIYVERFEDAAAPRDVVVTIRAVNEGRRTLSTLVRGRMLSFVVEELGPDNKPRATFECSGQHAPHAIPIEMMRDVRPGQAVHVPILLAEFCPRNAVFLRPGLHRVTPKLDPSVIGEGLEVEPYVAEALARQPALVRLATARGSFYEEPPKSGPAEVKAKPKPAETPSEEPKPEGQKPGGPNAGGPHSKGGAEAKGRQVSKK
jgi:hypothetical protein